MDIATLGGLGIGFFVIIVGIVITGGGVGSVFGFGATVASTDTLAGGADMNRRQRQGRKRWVLLSIRSTVCLAAGVLELALFESSWTPYIALSCIPVLLYFGARRHPAGFVLLWAVLVLGFFVGSAPYLMAPTATPAAVVVEEWGRGCFGCDLGENIPSLFFAWDGLLVSSEHMWGEDAGVISLGFTPPDGPLPPWSTEKWASIQVWQLGEEADGGDPFTIAVVEIDSQRGLVVEFAPRDELDDGVQIADSAKRKLVLPAGAELLFESTLTRADPFRVVVTDVPALLVPFATRSSYWERESELPTGSLGLTDLPEEEAYMLRGMGDPGETLFGEGAFDHLYVLRESASDTRGMPQLVRRMWLEEGSYALYGRTGSLLANGQETEFSYPFVLVMTLEQPGSYAQVDSVFASILRMKNDTSCECYLLAFADTAGSQQPVDTILRRSRGTVELEDRLITFSEHDEIEFWSTPPTFDRFTHDAEGFAYSGDVLAIFKNGVALKSPYLWYELPEHLRTVAVTFLGIVFAAFLAYWLVRPSYQNRSRNP